MSTITRTTATLDAPRTSSQERVLPVVYVEREGTCTAAVTLATEETGPAAYLSLYGDCR